MKIIEELAEIVLLLLIGLSWFRWLILLLGIGSIFILIQYLRQGKGRKATKWLIILLIAGVFMLTSFTLYIVLIVDFRIPLPIF